MIKTMLLLSLLFTPGAWATPKEIDCNELLTVLNEFVESGDIKEQEALSIYSNCQRHN